MSNIKTPHAAVVVYNYKVRGSVVDVTAVQANSVSTIKITNSIMSIQTAKHKATPSGTFTIVLAPSTNWIAKLTPGSWLSIHMAQREITENDLNNFNKQTLKMVGRIDSVRVSINVDSQTGTRSSIYTIEGKDWGQVLETNLFVDPMVLDNTDDNLGQAVRFGLGVLVAGPDGKSGWVSPNGLMGRLLKLWGSSELASTQGASLGGVVKSPTKVFPYSTMTLPKPLSQAMNITTSSLSSLLRSKLSTHSGTLTSYNKLQPIAEATGTIDPKLVIGGHPIWGLLNEACNPLLAELITEISFEKSSAFPVLYRRIRPFRVVFDESDKWCGSFFNVKRTKIPTSDIVRIETGTNWRDSFNFATVIPDTSLLTGDDAKQVGLAVARLKNGVKNNDNQISREGLRSLLPSTRFIPLKPGAKPEDNDVVATNMSSAVFNGQGPSANAPSASEALKASAKNTLGKTSVFSKDQLDISGLNAWSRIMTYWYFNTHNMLNGSISFMGQENYIAVGDNINIDADVLGDTAYIESQVKDKTTQALMHIESVQHRFLYSPQSGRSFVTDIAFVRGVFTDDQCSDLINPSEFAVEVNNTDITNPLDENFANVYKG